ncbi:cytochrome P450 [Methylohalobius crimeensis]|uniref:cytochrome P450 n=1 Tax=Methylohalobius crimeensis TaxID=244365 RepID=UPI0003B6D3E1|nr:cytochrome P450 [Methylohalobius crimeensis]
MIDALKNLFVTPMRILLVWLEGFWSILQIVGMGLSALVGSGSLKERLVSRLTAAPAQRAIFAILRAFLPNLALSRVLVKSYENTGTAVVTRGRDVREVLSRDADFEVVYGPRMRRLTEGENFFLGMQPGWDYERDVSDMRLAARRSDVAEIVLPRARKVAEAQVAESGGKLNLPKDLTLQVPWDMTATYFGTGGPSAEAMQDWTTTLFWYLFGDLGADPELDEKSMRYAAELRAYLDEAIAQRKASLTENDDVLNRCLALQSAGTPGMSDLGIRNNLLGLLVGAIPTISKACCLALDELLRRPDALAGAQAAAQADDDEQMAQYLWEALRFNPHNPVIYRRATRDTVIARSNLRSIQIKQGQMVFAANLSAMFDRLDVPDAGAFRTDRPWETYIHWGYGMHTCFGAAINRVVIPATLKPLLTRNNLRRAAGGAGQIDTGGTPFPQHFVVEFDPA